ncbi:MAG: dihydrodipicolinate synthase family protein [Bacteroidales bacterium]
MLYGKRDEMISEQTRGVYVISATPFGAGGAVDFDSLDTLVDFYLAQRVHGITLLGMMGEAHKLTFDESAVIVRRALERVAGRVPVIVGVSHSSLQVMKALAELSIDAGAAGVLVAPTGALRTDDQILAYYASVASALGPSIPWIYQDYPQSSGVYLSAALFGRMVAAFSTLVMLKAEDCPGLGKISGIRADAATAGSRRVSILVGNGGLYFPQSLGRGADGVMTGFAYPDMLVQVYERFVSGDHDGAEDLYDRYLPLVCYEQQPGYGLAVRKEILRRRGALRCAKVRVPGPSLTARDLAEIDRLMARLHE